MENWHTIGREMPSFPVVGDKDVPFLLLGHCHVDEGFGSFSGAYGRWRASQWDLLLRGFRWPEGSQVVGRGWDAMVRRGVGGLPLAGTVKPPEVPALTRRAVCGYCVTPSHWSYVTSKLRYYACGGCAPVLSPLYGHQYVPPDAGVPYRAGTAEELQACVDHWTSRPGMALEYAAHMEQLTRPSVAKVVEAVELAAAGRLGPAGDWASWERLGGYRDHEQVQEAGGDQVAGDDEAETGGEGG